MTASCFAERELVANAYHKPKDMKGNKMNDGYDEETLINIRHDGMEIYGQNGYGWYTYTRDAEHEIFDRFEKEQSANPLFTYIKGIYRSQLLAKGFVASSNE